MVEKAAFGYPGVVIRLACKTRLVGRGVVTVAVAVSLSPLPSSLVSAVNVVVGVDEPVVC